LMQRHTVFRWPNLRSPSQVACSPRHTDA
jgi:hypothetical protein